MKAKWVFMLLVSSVGGAYAAPGIPDVDGKGYRELIETIKPAEKELKWLEIEWGADLWAARERAAAEGKPIFLWEMDGHPLACT